MTQLPAEGVSPPPEHPTVGEALAETVAKEQGDPRLVRTLRELDALDRAIYSAVARTASPTVDDALRRLSNSANYSQLWLGLAGGLFVFGGRRGKRAAVLGVTAVGVTSAVVNLGVKPILERTRPDRVGQQVPLARHVRMPSSTSFPSGHSASAFAFAEAVSDELPLLALPLRLLAAAVAYSRVHTGVHYPGDVVIGSIVGAATGDIVMEVGRLLLKNPLARRLRR